MIADEPQTELALLARQLEELNQIGAALAAERDTARLLDLILTKAREITSSDAGSLYLVEAVESPAAGDQPPAIEDSKERKLLRFAVAQNASISVPLRTTTLEITETSIAGYVALAAERIAVGSRAHADRIARDAFYRFLSQIPWTREIRRIPAIALGHHEKLNGRGYPHKLSAPRIPCRRA